MLLKLQSGCHIEIYFNDLVGRVKKASILQFVLILLLLLYLEIKLKLGLI